MFCIIQIVFKRFINKLLNIKKKLKNRLKNFLIKKCVLIPI